jgi:transcriptional regulator with PAS, ATPase and Fis domain
MAGFVDKLADRITNILVCKDKKERLSCFPEVTPIEQDEIKKIEELTIRLDEKEKQLYKKTALLEGILNSQFDCIVRTNKEGILTYCNNTYRKVFYNENLCKGICIYETVHPEYLDKVTKSHHKYFESPYTSSIEALLQTNKGYR